MYMCAHTHTTFYRCSWFCVHNYHMPNIQLRNFWDNIPSYWYHHDSSPPCPASCPHCGNSVCSEQTKETPDILYQSSKVSLYAVCVSFLPFRYVQRGFSPSQIPIYFIWCEWVWVIIGKTINYLQYSMLIVVSILLCSPLLSLSHAQS